MAISHIMRAEEWISTAPVHKNLYDAFGWPMPLIAHLPVILNPSGKGKLSKRSVAFAEGGRKVPVLLHEFVEGGYLPEAVINFLTNIGWSFGDDREVFTVQETIERFDLSRVNPAGGAFPIEKLDWLNGVYIREMDDDELAGRLLPVFTGAGYAVDLERVRRVVPLIKVRIKTLNDALDSSSTVRCPPADLSEYGARHRATGRSGCPDALPTSAQRRKPPRLAAVGTEGGSFPRVHRPASNAAVERR